MSGTRTRDDEAAAGLLERADELASLDAWLAAASAGDARLVLLEGPAGIGKSRLLAEARRRAPAAGLRVLGARGSELEREFPFGIVRQLFEATVRDPASGPAALSGPAAATRAIFDAPGDETASDGSFSLLHGLYWLTVNLASEGPLLLAVDDLHWCDRPSLRYLAYLVRRLEGLPVLVAATLRPAEPGADAALLTELAHDPLAVSLRPAPLSVAGARALALERLGQEPEPAFCEALHRTTGGNPLLLHELLKAVEAEGVQPLAASVDVVRELGPRAASRAVLVRLARLPAEVVAVARAAAVLGDAAEPDLLAALAEVDEDTVARATVQLAQTEILRPDPPLDFVHPLVRAAVSQDVPLVERQRQHARAARLLADRGAREEQVAAHMLAMPRRRDPWVVETLDRAARVALGRGAADSAAAYLRRALEEPAAPEQRAGLVLRLGLAEANSNGPEAADHLGEAYAGTVDPRARAAMAVPLARLLTFTGRAPEAASLAAEATAGLGGADPDLRRQLEAARLVVSFFDSSAVSLDDPGFDPPEADLRDAGPGAHMLAGVVAYRRAMLGEPADRCAELALAAAGDGVLQQVENGGVPISGSFIVLAQADRPEALELASESLAAAHRSGSLFAGSSGVLFRALSLLCRGDLVEAESLFAQHQAMYESWGFRAVREYASAFQADTLVERGDLAGARRAIAAADAPGPRPWTASGLAWLHAARLRLLVRSGAHAEALALADECGRRFPPILNPAWLPWRSLKAEALHGLGRADEAVEAAAAELEPARRWGAPRALGRTLRVLGSVLGEDGLPHLEEAVAVLEGSLARLELARALAAHGTALRHARRPSDAREPLRRALELAAVCEAAPLVEHVRAELHATGARPRTDAASGLGSLTTSERRVAELAAHGQSNRDIAQTLFVTPKTVEVHLSNAYRKLGIRSRRELAGALAG